jgi:hypothetical protein
MTNPTVLETTPKHKNIKTQNPLKKIKIKKNLRIINSNPNNINKKRLNLNRTNKIPKKKKTTT